MNRNKNAFFNGVRDGIPIALGYFAVAFSLGIVAQTSRTKSNPGISLQFS